MTFSQGACLGAAHIAARQGGHSHSRSNLLTPTARQGQQPFVLGKVQPLRYIYVVLQPSFPSSKGEQNYVLTVR